MSDSYGRPRIESFGSFVVEVEEEPAPAECLTFDDYVAVPTYEEIGSGGEGTITLSSDALVSTEADTYCIAVVIMASGYTDEAGPFSSSNAFDISSDETTEVPNYLQQSFGGEEFDCFNDIWRTKAIGPGFITDQVDTTTDDAPHEGESFIGQAYIAYRGLQRELPAGTTITYDIDALTNSATTAKAYLIKNAALYTGAPKANNGDGEILSFFDDGGIVFSVYYEDGAGANVCGIFDGNNPGSLSGVQTNGDNLITVSPTIPVTWWSPPGGPPPCTQMDADCPYTYGIKIHCTAAGGGTYDTGLPGGGSDNPRVSGSWAWPAQGYF